MFTDFINKELCKPSFNAKINHALNLTNKKYRCTYSSSVDWYSIMFDDSITTQRIIGSFSLSGFPANCGTLITSFTTVYDEYSNKGLGNILVELQETVAKQQGYTYLIGTVSIYIQPYIEKILIKRDWDKIDEFINGRSKNLIHVWSKNLNRRSYSSHQKYV